MSHNAAFKGEPMTNHVTNVITTETNDELLKIVNSLSTTEITQLRDNDSLKLDFNKLLPRPKGLKRDVVDWNVTSTESTQLIVFYLRTLPRNEASRKMEMLQDIPYSNIETGPVSKDKYYGYVLLAKYYDMEIPNGTIAQVEYGKKIYDTVLKYGYLNWYNWSINHWGTENNAFNAYYTRDSPQAILTFKTLLNSPTPIIIELSKRHPDIRMTITYSNRDKTCGVYQIQDGKIESSNA